MNIRKFLPEDANFCFKTRVNPFIQKFSDELSSEAISAGVNAYMPDDYIRMAEEVEFFIMEKNEKSIAFFTIKKIDTTTAEIPLVYIDLDYLGNGIGTACLRYIEDWILTNWKKVKELVVDTVIPEYNGGFYIKSGFVPTGETACNFPDMSLKALRLTKKLNTDGVVIGEMTL